jgi:pimeloyl-ACP methyl ester carboxylesterase
VSIISKRYCNSSLPLVWSDEPLYDWREQNDRYENHETFCAIIRTKGGTYDVEYHFCLIGLYTRSCGPLQLWSYPGKPKPFVDENGRPLPGSISEKVFVTINGVEQGMFIKSKNDKNPMLLYLHGGMPDYFLTQRYPTSLEDYFTVVWWEQRGSGISYSANIPPETMTLEQMISDTLEVTKYLRNRFHKEKIYLMGHSGGTFIGIQAAARAPELYYAYIGVAQMSNYASSTKISTRFPPSAAW